MPSQTPTAHILSTKLPSPGVQCAPRGLCVVLSRHRHRIHRLMPCVKSEIAASNSVIVSKRLFISLALLIPTINPDLCDALRECPLGFRHLCHTRSEILTWVLLSIAHGPTISYISVRPQITCVVHVDVEDCSIHVTM